jgi:Reverse transcriptase (RNA-dependent DNA polymerase).
LSAIQICIYVLLIFLVFENINRKRVCTGGKINGKFKISIAVRQGDVLSAVLFNFILHEIMKMELKGSTIYKSFQACAYDDISLLVRNMTVIVGMFGSLEQRNKHFGLKINKNKNHLHGDDRK